MNIREISDIFKDTAADITALKSYNFGWASDRVRQGNTEDFQELNEFPRVFFAVPTITGSDQTRKQDTYQVTLFFDDLLGYDNEGDEDPTLQIDKWANLQQYANYFVQRLNKIKQSILPNYLFIPEAPSITFDSFTGIQRMITVQLSFNLVVPTNCDPSIITLVQCIANIVTSSNLTASLTTVLKFAASLEGRATVTADINFVQKLQSSLASSATLTTSALVSKLASASLTGTGTTTADLTVGSTDLLLDLYPDAAAAYSLRKLRTAYTGSAVRVRRSSDNTEQDIGFVSGQLDTVSLLAFCGSGNGFVTTWYDQSGSARDARQTTQASQPQIVFTGTVLLQGSKPTINLNGTSNSLNMININNILSSIGHFNSFGVYYNIDTDINTVYESVFSNLNARVLHQYSRVLPNRYGIGGRRLISDTFNYNESSAQSISFVLISNIIKYSSSDLFVYQNGNNVVSNLNYQTDGLSGAENTDNFLFFYRNTSPPQYFKGNISEIVIYTTDKSSDRINIETNINTNYAIY
jgi:hypothetical protein